MDHKKVSKAVEDICHLGCTIVYEKIETLEDGKDISESKEFDSEERKQLLKELKAIMDVYDKDS